MQAQAVQQLRLVRRQQLRQPRCFGDVRVCSIICRANIRHSLQHRHALQDGGHFFQRRGGAETVQAQDLAELHNAFAVTPGQCIEQLVDIAAVHTAQHLAHAGFCQRARSEGNRLVGEGQRIAHRTARCTGQQTQRLRLGRHAFGGQYLHQVFQNSFWRHGPQIELQATREHGRGHLLGIGRGQHKLEVSRRLLQRLEHGVESRVGEHVDLVDHEDLEASDHRLVNRLLEQLGDFVHAPVGSSLELGVVHKTATVDVHAGLANAARRGGDVTLPVRSCAVERLGQNARHRGFAHAAGAGEQISMVQALRAERIAQGLDHMRLPDHLRKVLGTVFAGKDEVRHAAILKCSPMARDRLWRSARAGQVHYNSK